MEGAGVGVGEAPSAPSRESSTRSFGAVASRSVETPESRWRRRATRELRKELVPSTERRRSSVMRRQDIWTRTRTVDLDAETQDMKNEHIEVHRTTSGCGRRCWYLQGWWLTSLVATLTALTGCAIDIATEGLSSFRTGWCSDAPFRTIHDCPNNSWSDWGSGSFGLIMYVVPGLIMCMFSALLCSALSPEAATAAAGSGIPEMKVIMNGFILPDAISIKTLCAKVPGLILSVGGGMAVGNDEPMVITNHITRMKGKRDMRQDHRDTQTNYWVHTSNFTMNSHVRKQIRIRSICDFSARRPRQCRE